ncbi:MAG: aminotransferase class III-fold pyridoxal phosphate-dependent enzyme [Cytophagaceae bacterium]|jgi:acetylornithine/succinyldiaminopimelate/putrescine aminotransferase|nr:aminotransferase class III-fold pyridoxal phosphate-dependent enzyme [Cytophagaceae bacterium]
MFTPRQLFQKHLAPTSPAPLAIEITHASGVYMYGPKGERYLDLISGIGVSALGHQHPKITEAIHQQIDRHLHLMVYGEIIQSIQVQLAEALVATGDASIDSVYFVNSGAEATEGAMKLAKRYTGRFEFISCINAYHGSTQGALSLMGNEWLKEAYRPLLPGIRHIRFGEESDLEWINEKTAALFIESVQGEAGVRSAPHSYWKALRQRCTEVGCLLIVDEIQSGFGRTGTFWAYQGNGIVPDVVLTAKGMGGGMPLGAFMAPKAIMQCLSEFPILGHLTTYGGHPAACAAALATIQVLKNDTLVEHVNAKSQYFIQQLQHPGIKEIRAKGLMMAVEFEQFSTLKKYIDAAIEKGLLTDWFLFCDNSMRIAPPLTISYSEIDEACSIINQLT